MHNEGSPSINSVLQEFSLNMLTGTNKRFSFVATNDQNQPVCGADLFSESTAHANSAAFYC